MSHYPPSLANSIICDMTYPQAPCGPLYTPDFEGAMQQRAEYGCTFTSLTIASDEPSIELTVSAVAEARHYFLSRPEQYVLVETVEDIYRAQRDGKLAVGFHFQGSNGLLGNTDFVEMYKKLGVGHMLLAYNTRGFAGDGCHEESDTGLSRFGRMLVEEMNRVGMIVDVTHTGYRTSMDAMSASSQPVIFSHSNAKALFGHERNITDDQARACAETGGVIGVNGVGLFLSEARFDASAQMIARHADYFANLVGPQHVGIGLDSVHDLDYFLDHFAKANTRRYPSGGYLQSRTPSFAGPAVIPPLADELLRLGWSVDDVKGFLGENWIRVMQHVWG